MVSVSSCNQTEMSKVRKWEDLKFDCLVNILRRVGIESLLLDVPFVCKSWHKVSLDHSCWQHIGFSDPYSLWVHRFINEYRVKNFSIGGFIRLMVARGLGKSTSLALPASCDAKDLYHVSENCQELTSLSIKVNCTDDESVVPKLIGKLIGKWKLLEELTLSMLRLLPTRTKNIFLPEIVSQIEQNCKKFYSFTVRRGKIEKEDALAIANHLPKITKLSLQHCFIEQKNLEIIILGCKGLEFLDVNKCRFKGIWEDKKLKDLASHIKTLNLDASFYLDYNDSDSDQYDYDLNADDYDQSLGWYVL